MTADKLARWLKDNGCVEYLHERGYGHMCGEEMADLLLHNFTVTPREGTTDDSDPFEDGYVEGFDAALGKVYALLRSEVFSDATRRAMIAEAAR